MGSNRLLFIDIARGICIILVVMGHYQPDNSPDWYVGLRHFIISFRMPLFMFVSGYIYQLTMKPIAYGTFVRKKFERLMIPYFFVSSLIITLKLLSSNNMHVENPVDFSAFYGIFYYPTAGYFLWFIYTLFLIFLIIPFFNTKRKLFILLIISFLFYLLPLQLPDMFCLNELKKILVYFVLGCFYYKVSDTSFLFKIRKPALGLSFVFYVFFYLIIAHCNLEVIPLADKFFLFLLAMSGVIFVLSLCIIILPLTGISSKLIKVASYSYTIYLFHTTFQGFAKSFFVKVSDQFPLENATYFIISAFVVISVGVLMPIGLNKIISKHSRVLSYLIGIKFIGRKSNKFQPYLIVAKFFGGKNPIEK